MKIRICDDADLSRDIAERALVSVRAGREQENVTHRPVTDEETDAAIKRAVERESEFYRPVREGDDT